MRTNNSSLSIPEYSIKKISSLIIGISFCLNVHSQTNEYCTEDFYSPLNLFRLQKPIDSTINPVYQPIAHPFFEMYAPCTNRQTNLRGVGFIHGLGGSIAAWDKQISFTDSAYQTASFGVDYGSANYEVSFRSVGQRLKNELSNGFTNIDESYNLIHSSPRCHNDDYVIAHSQGGIAARYLDWQWNRNFQGSFGARNFYGLVTFGTPHAGAHVGLTRNEHYSFVGDVVSTIFLHEVDEEIYNYTSKFPGTFISSGLYDLKGRLDSLIKNELAPLMLSSVHTPTLEEMIPGSPLMTNLNNHWGSLHRVAFFGIEDSPECWRVMDQVVNKGAEEYPLWGAQPDDEFKNQMEDVRGIHELKIEENNKFINHKRSWRNATLWAGAPFLNGQIVRKRVQNEKRQKSIDFLNNANTEWRYLIGSYHRDSFEIITQTSYDVKLVLNFPTVNGRAQNPITLHFEFNTLSDAQAFAQKVDGTVSTKVQTQKVLKFYPSDGVVLAHSQKAYPGIKEADIDFMLHNNHFQERNSSETRRVMRALYEGVKYDKYFQLTH